METPYQRVQIKRYPNYDIDTNGDIWSNVAWRGKNKERKIKPFKGGYDYLRVRFLINGKQRQEYVHNLMCEHFIGNKNGLQIRHLDGNKNNNALYNLKLGTSKENAEDRDKHNTTFKGHLHSELHKAIKQNNSLKADIADLMQGKGRDFIVRAVKNFDEMLSMLTELRNAIRYGDKLPQATTDARISAIIHNATK